MSVKRQAVFNTAGNITSLFCQWLIMLIIPRIGGFNDAGIFSLAVSIASIFSVIAAFGTRNYQVTEGYENTNERQFMATRLAVSAVGFIFCAVYMAVGNISSKAAITTLIYLFYRNLLIIADVWVATLQIKNRLDLGGIAFIFEGFVSVVTFLSAYRTTGSLIISTALMACCGGGIFIALVILFRSKVYHVKLLFSASLNEIGRILKKCFPLFLATVFPIILTAVPKIVLNSESSAQKLGIFSTISVPTVAITAIASSMFAPLITVFSNLYKNNDYRKISKTFCKTLLVMSIFGVVFCGAAVLFGKSFFGILYGQEILGYIDAFFIVVAAAVFSAIAACSSTVLITAKRFYFVAGSSFLSLVFGAVLCRVLIPLSPVKGAAWALLAAHIFQTFITSAAVLVFNKKSRSITLHDYMYCHKIRCAVVTGPTGAVGIALLKKLIAENVRVYAVMRPNSPRNKGIPDNALVTKIECDLTDYASLKEKIKEPVDAFFHLAWQGTSGAGRDDQTLQEQNVAGALSAALAAKALSCKVFVGAGSQAEYGRADGELKPDTPENPETQYGKAKLEAGNGTRELCKRYGVRHEWVRILSVYGPHDGENSMISSALRKLRNGETPQYTKGEQIWDYLYEDDAANALFLAAENGRNGQVYVLGGGQGKPLSEYIKALHKAANAPPPVFGAVPYSEKQVMRLVADISKMTNDTGFIPEITFEEGIKRTVEMAE